MPTVDHNRPATRLDITVFGVRSATAVLSGYSTEHGEYDTLELSFGPEATVTLAGDSLADLRYLVDTLARALDDPVADPE